MSKIGNMLGPYEILSPLGAGGMGEVYRARDARLDRDVAIKILPAAVSGDRERVLRFEREAKLLAALNHPHIAHIYGFEEAKESKFLVLEYVEGETLAARLRRGPIPVDEALLICKQVAEALETAHDKGVIHRDLKPGNVMLTPEGKVKVLDFGLARAIVESSSSGGGLDSLTITLQSPAITADYTRPGVVLGTAAYMSPEQARGKPVDRRSDIWSFGVVLLECLTGKTPYAGETLGDSIGAILHKEPHWADLPDGTPPTITLLLKRCLTKDIAKRLRDVGDARIELDAAIADPTSSILGFAASALRSDSGSRRLPAAAVVAIIVVALGFGFLGLAAGRRLTNVAVPLVRKYEIPLQEQGTFNAGQPAISPDGTMVAYVDQDRIRLRRLSSWDVREVEGSQRSVIPFWSPDSKWLGFGRGNELLKVPAVGGTPVVITKAPGPFSLVGGAAWSADGRIYFSTGDTGILEVSAEGGEPRVFLAQNSEDDDDFHEVASLPGEHTLVFTVHSRTRPWYLACSDGKQRKTVFALEQYHVATPVYSPTGHILFQRFAGDVGVWALPFDPVKLETTGSPFLVWAGDGDPSLSDTGTLALTRRMVSVQAGRQVMRMDLDSSEFHAMFSSEGALYDPAMSPDGKTLAIAGFRLNATDIWLLDIQSGARTRLTFDDSKSEVLPSWSPDGKELAMAKTKASSFERVASDDTIHFAAVDGSGETRPPIAGGYPSFDHQWKYVAFVRIAEQTGPDIYYAPLDGTAQPAALLQGKYAEEQPAISPDGGWLAYSSNESGFSQVYLTRFPSGQGKWQVSANEGVFPTWSPDSARIYFVGAEVGVYDVALTTEPRVMLTTPRVVLDGAKLGVDPYIGLEPTADGKGMIIIKPAVPPGAQAIGVLENWFEEFKNR